MSNSKKYDTEIRVINPVSYHPSTDKIVKVREIHDFQLTPPKQSVAWNGTLLLYEDREGKKYAWRHSGNSNNIGGAYRISRKQAEDMKKMTAREADEYLHTNIM